MENLSLTRVEPQIPRKGGSLMAMSRLNIPQIQREQLVSLAHHQGVTPAELLRRAVAFYLAAVASAGRNERGQHPAPEGGRESPSLADVVTVSKPMDR